MGKGRGEGRQRLAKAGRDRACTSHRAGSPLRRLLDGFLGQRNLEACALGSWFCCLTALYATPKQSHHWPTHLYVTSSLNYEKWQWSLKGSLLETTAAPGYSRYFPDSSTTSATGDPPTAQKLEPVAMVAAFPSSKEGHTPSHSENKKAFMFHDHRPSSFSLFCPVKF